MNQEKLEENIVNTIDYSTKGVNKYSGIIDLILTKIMNIGLLKK